MLTMILNNNNNSSNSSSSLRATSTASSSLRATSTATTSSSSFSSSSLLVLDDLPWLATNHCCSVDDLEDDLVQALSRGALGTFSERSLGPSLKLGPSTQPRKPCRTLKSEWSPHAHLCLDLFADEEQEQFDAELTSLLPHVTHLAQLPDAPTFDVTSLAQLSSVLAPMVQQPAQHTTSMRAHSPLTTESGVVTALPSPLLEGSCPVFVGPSVGAPATQQQQQCATDANASATTCTDTARAGVGSAPSLVDPSELLAVTTQRSMLLLADGAALVLAEGVHLLVCDDTGRLDRVRATHLDKHGQLHCGVVSRLAVHELSTLKHNTRVQSVPDRVLPGHCALHTHTLGYRGRGTAMVVRKLYGSLVAKRSVARVLKKDAGLLLRARFRCSCPLAPVDACQKGRGRRSRS
jgi:hypothetical protein